MSADDVLRRENYGLRSDYEAALAARREGRKVTRFKDQRDLSVGEILEHKRTGKLPESDEYVAARREALERNGLDDDGPKPPSEWTADDHLRHQQNRNKR